MRYLVGRAVCLCCVFLLATFTSYCLLNLAPGDIVDLLLGESAGGDSTARRKLEHELGIDRPIVLRYLSWLFGVFNGDFGRSAITSQPVIEALAERIPATLELVALSIIIAIIIAVPLGVWSAYRRDGIFDRLLSTATFLLLSLPIFVTGVLLLFTVSVWLQLLPASGYVAFLENPLQNLRGYILPVATVVLIEISVLVRILRSDMITVLQEDYIAFARAKGLSTSDILFHHALRPASINMVTMVGLQIGAIISSSVITERLFSIPGIGSLLIQSVQSHDDSMVQGVVTAMVIMSVAVNLTVDIIYTVIDPRIGGRH